MLIQTMYERPEDAVRPSATVFVEYVSEAGRSKFE